MNAPKYIDIGHASPDAIAWLYRDSRLWTHKAAAGTHKDVYGMEALNHWRGRHEPETGRVSVAPPVASDFHNIPP